MKGYRRMLCGTHWKRKFPCETARARFIIFLHGPLRGADGPREGHSPLEAFFQHSLTSCPE
jgi:hypothetical protein